MTSLNLALNTTTNVDKETNLQHRLLRSACYIFNIDLPDTPKRGIVALVLQRLVLIAVVLLSFSVLFNFEDNILPHISAPIQTFLNGFSHDADKSAIPTTFAPSVIRAFLLCFWFAALLVIISAVQGKAHKYTTNSLILERERSARQAAESTLRLLKAQIEPHFLFNTLGAVQQLAEGKAPEAAALTSDLITFLRSTLSSLRADSISLADDLSTCDAYLHIMEARLTRRLKYKITCPPELAQFKLPTTLLLTLVENAIKHGIERAPDGGRIDINVQRVENTLCISVADTGHGFDDNIGQGVGLQNIRDRLSLLFGDKASLSLEANEPSGVIATLIFPYPHSA